MVPCNTIVTVAARQPMQRRPVLVGHADALINDVWPHSCMPGDQGHMLRVMTVRHILRVYTHRQRFISRHSNEFAETKNNNLQLQKAKANGIYIYK